MPERTPLGDALRAMAVISKPLRWQGKSEAKGYVAGYRDAMRVAGTIADAWTVEENKPETMTACCTASEPCEKHQDARHQEVPDRTNGGRDA